MRATTAVCATALLLAGCAGASGGDEPGGMTFEQHCELRTGVVELAATPDAEGVVVTWHDESGGLDDATFWVAHRAAADAAWTVVATLELTADAERRYVHRGATPAGEYTVAEDDGCVDGPEGVCAPEQPCPVATTARDEG
ncbi:hypothetical protein [Cellulomonas shaoxiangyii]|uniref:Lipoprotein n=1 Tax=Cellulomonas shaoxiangyii TaxID=2566013 RepID=A0A4P7SFB0_9CELL|nr:hypothetical protein [Cellulomonas shaoxiangyii]QCB92211.1 hypothetical protein E5225_00220 [Cellulomonas shaoxiangyii]TGY82633.1 hypothetical protein E5226_13050 [Cellulomonas shaoxiangyii]